MNKYIGHFKTITKHKWHVFHACRKSGIPWRGITHDLSKFSPIEFFNSVKFFDGVNSPINNEKKEKGHSLMWMSHKGRNSHHWEYWIDFSNGEMYCMKMPITDLKELLCDWIGAGKAYNKEKWNEEEAFNYYHNRRDKMLFHNETRALLEEALNVLRLEGEEAYYKYIKEELKYE